MACATCALRCPLTTTTSSVGLSSLNAAIKIVNLAKETSSITPTTAVFESVSATLAIIGVVSSMDPCPGRFCSWRCESDWWWHCARFAYRFPNRRTVTGIQDPSREGWTSLLSWFAHAKDDKEKNPSWRAGLKMIFHVFRVRSVVPV